MYDTTFRLTRSFRNRYLKHCHEIHVEDGRLFRYERPFGEFTRSVALPEGTDDVEARAHYANGVLEVHVQKREQSKPRQIPVTTTVEGGSTD